MTADVPAPQSSAGYHSAGRFPSGRYRWSSPPAAAPSGRSRRCSAGRGSSHAAPDPASSPAPADPPPEVQPDPRQRRQGFRPFAVHRQPQGSVSSEVHAPVADNHYLFAAQVVPAAVDEGFICQPLRIALDAVRLKIVQAGASPALHPGVGVDTLYFADPDVVVERRANKLVTQGSTAAPDRQPTSGSADPSGDRWSSIANRRGSARPRR